MCGPLELLETYNEGMLDADPYDQAMQLLINRYRILLTRGIKGTFVFCEDKETGDFLKHRITAAKGNIMEDNGIHPIR